MVKTPGQRTGIHSALEQTDPLKQFPRWVNYKYSYSFGYYFFHSFNRVFSILCQNVPALFSGKGIYCGYMVICGSFLVTIPRISHGRESIFSAFPFRYPDVGSNLLIKFYLFR